MTTTTNIATDEIKAWMAEAAATYTVPQTDDAIRAWLQGELQASLQGNGLEWLETPIELAIEEALDRPEAPAADEAETMAGARHHLQRASRAAAEGDWREVADTLYWLKVALYWVLPGAPGSRARELQHELDAVEAAVEAAQLEPGSLDWITWQGPEYCELLIQQPYYQEHGLVEVLQAWEDGVPIGIVDDSYLTSLPDWIDDDDDGDDQDQD